MSLTVVTPPAIEPVTFEMVYDHLHDPPQNDDHFARLIASARTEAENFTEQAFIEQTLLYTSSRIVYYASNCITLPRHPVISIESVEYYDSDNVLQTIDEADYYLTADGTLRFVEGFDYPSLYARGDAVQIEYKAGYGASAETVPEPIKQAILIGVELQYSPLSPAEREAAMHARDALLRPYRVFGV